MVRYYKGPTAGTPPGQPVRWITKHMGAEVVVTAKLWFEARDLAAQQLGCSPYEINPVLHNEKNEEADSLLETVW